MCEAPFRGVNILPQKRLYFTDIYPNTQGYKNKAAYEAGGIQALIPKKPGPKGAHKLTKQGQSFIDSYVADHPSASASETNAKLREKTGISVHNRTVERYLSKKRQGSR